MPNINNLLLDQNVACKASQAGSPYGYDINIAQIINTHLPNQRNWITSAFAFLEYLGLSNKALPCPEICLKSSNESLPSRIIDVRNQARIFFENCQEIQLDQLKNRAAQVKTRLKQTQLANEIFESRATFIEDNDYFTKDIALRLAWDYCQNEVLYKDFKEEALDVLITFLCSDLINRQISPARFIISSWSNLNGRLIEAYDNCNVEISKSLVKKRTAKLRADRLDLDIINFSLIGIPTKNQMENITYEPITIISEENRDALIADLTYFAGTYRAAFKRLKELGDYNYSNLFNSGTIIFVDQNTGEYITKETLAIDWANN